MERIVINNIPLYQFEIFEKYPEILNFTSTRIGGISEGEFANLNVGLHVGDEKKLVLENRKILAEAIGIKPEEITSGEQTHETDIHVVKECEIGRGAIDWLDGFPKTDALITIVKGIPLTIFTADCAAVSYYDPVNEVVGIAHSGKKGVEGNINQKVITKMTEEFGTEPSDLIVGVGPCIYPCCYEIDIPGEIQAELLESGVEIENIENSDLCTVCHSNIFYSHRKEKGKTGRFANIIMLH